MEKLKRKMLKNHNPNIIKLITKYLSVREHSKYELIRKLIAKDFNKDEISVCIHEFTLNNLQSDERYTDDFITSRLKSGKGPLLIKKELQNNGIDDYLINKKIDFIKDDEWNLIAKKAFDKKIKNIDKENIDIKKIKRFLVSRGFTNKMIKYVLENKK